MIFSKTNALHIFKVMLFYQEQTVYLHYALTCRKDELQFYILPHGGRISPFLTKGGPVAPE